jgi:hypothetical protein
MRTEWNRMHDFLVYFPEALGFFRAAPSCTVDEQGERSICKGMRNPKTPHRAVGFSFGL